MFGYPPLNDLESRLFSGIYKDRKQVGLSQYGEWV